MVGAALTRSFSIHGHPAKSKRNSIVVITKSQTTSRFPLSTLPENAASQPEEQPDISAYLPPLSPTTEAVEGADKETNSHPSCCSPVPPPVLNTHITRFQSTTSASTSTSSFTLSLSHIGTPSLLDESLPSPSSFAVDTPLYTSSVARRSLNLGLGLGLSGIFNPDGSAFDGLGALPSTITSKIKALSLRDDNAASTQAQGSGRGRTRGHGLGLFLQEGRGDPWGWADPDAPTDAPPPAYPRSSRKKNAVSTRASPRDRSVRDAENIPPPPPASASASASSPQTHCKESSKTAAQIKPKTKTARKSTRKRVYAPTPASPMPQAPVDDDVFFCRAPVAMADERLTALTRSLKGSANATRLLASDA